MGKETGISWTDSTWNIARGCTKVDEDCKFCYMYRDSFEATRYDPYKVIRTKTVFDLPLKLKEPSKIFTCSLTDFFHEGCDSFRNEAWDIIRKCPQHIFQILTKRPERIKECLPVWWEDINYLEERVWLGTSVGSMAGMKRAQILADLGVDCIKFLSLEPLHGKIILPQSVLEEIDWVIIGGESGNENGKYRYRPCQLDWIASLVYQCRSAGVAVFVKQLGTHLSKELKLSDRHGGNIEEFPENLKLREFPSVVIA